MLINHLLLIFKFYIYSARSTKQLNFDDLKITIKKNMSITETDKNMKRGNIGFQYANNVVAVK